MKERLIILSDLWGSHNAEWVLFYVSKLSNVFDIQFYDCCELGEIDVSNLSEQSLHEQFVNGGIVKAVEKLVELEKDKLNILAFSVGGTIAWKANILGLKVNRLIALSSNRLRYEIEKPIGEIKLYFGEIDQYIPSETWLNSLEIDFKIILQKGHSLYKDDEIINMICEEFSDQ